MVTVRVILAVAASKQWELHQMDVHNVFLHGDLEAECFGNLKYFLGIEVARAQDGIFLCHEKHYKKK
ncbi:retrovirus-related pol polyprotein from transposon TNT 1-94 [Tanacetum coccineum]